MKTTIFTLLFSILTAHCAIYKTQDKQLSRIVRSPHITKSDTGDSSIVFRTQNWSGVARGANGAQGVFSGAAASAGGGGGVAPATDEAFSLAASGASGAAAPVKDKLEDRFGGSDSSDLHYIKFNTAGPNFNNPYIPDYHGNRHWPYGGHGQDFHKSFSAYQSGDYNYERLNSGSNSQAFAKSEDSSNVGSGCDDTAQNGFASNRQPNTAAISQSQAYSNAAGVSKYNTQNIGQSSSNTFSKSQAKSLSSSGQSNGGYGSGLYASGDQQQQNGALNANLQSTDESRTFFQSEFPNSGYQQDKSFGSGFSDAKSFQNGGNQQVESYGNGFGSSQGSQTGDQQVKPQSNGFTDSQGYQYAGGNKKKSQGNSNGFNNDQGQKAHHGFSQYRGEDYGSQISKGFERDVAGSTNGNEQYNYNRQDISSNSRPNNFGRGFSGHDQRYSYGRGYESTNYQTGMQSEGLQSGDASGQSTDSVGSLTSNANSHGKESLSSSSGASGHEDLQSTLSGALDLASQGLQASQKQPCSTCQKSSYAFSNAKSNSGSAIALSIGG